MSGVVERGEELFELLLEGFLLGAESGGFFGRRRIAFGKSATSAGGFGLLLGELLGLLGKLGDFVSGRLAERIGERFGSGKKCGAGAVAGAGGGSRLVRIDFSGGAFHCGRSGGKISDRTIGSRDIREFAPDIFGLLTDFVLALSVFVLLLRRKLARAGAAKSAVLDSLCVGEFFNFVQQALEVFERFGIGGFGRRRTFSRRTFRRFARS